MEDDPRFAHIATDPKFRRIPKGARKIKIDKRFKSMFEDKKFKVKYTTDKRGRPVNHTSTEDLKRYYALSSGDESDEEADKDVKPPKSELELTNKADVSLSDDVKVKLRNLSVDYARGESHLLAESSSDDESEEEAEEDTIDHKWGELDNDAECCEASTTRLAACNMDWDRMRAVDLMVLFSSFLPSSGVVKSVAIYPSEFGKERLKEEEVKGPIELVENKVAEGEVEDTEEGAKYHMEKLRQYQLNRLKYYYAVITCDTVKTADKIYSECDGLEYESSATKIDLRFIPEDMTFDDLPKESCDKLPELNRYQPRFFTTTALQQAKVDLTWDETDPDRIEFSQKLSSGKIEELSKQDLQNYLAGSDDESDSNNGESENEEGVTTNPIDKYKLLLQDIEEKEQEKKNNEIEMEVTWGINLKHKAEDLVQKKMADEDGKTPFEKYLEKRKEKRKQKRKLKKEADESEDDMPSDIDVNDPYFAEELNNPEFKKVKSNKRKVEDDENGDNVEAEDLELLVMDEDDDKNHFSLKKIQKLEEQATKKNKKKKKALKDEEKSDEFKVDVNDERFSALYTSHLYNIDPTDSHFKKTKGMDSLIQEKIKRREIVDEEEQPKKKKRSNAESSVLVKSVKRKTLWALKDKKAIK